VDFAIKLIQLPGEGMFRRTNEYFAIKVIAQDILHRLHGNIAEDPLREISALQCIGDNHQNIIGQVDCGRNDDSIYSVMRFASRGELFDNIQIAEGEMEPLTEPQARRMVCHILDGLQRLQQLGIAHRDMSVENILLSQGIEEDGNEDEGEYRGVIFSIIDFGMCIMCQRREGLEEAAEDTLDASSFLPVPCYPAMGKKNFMAPEVYMQNRDHVDPMSTDMWAVGVILFTALTGIFPIELPTTTDSSYRFIAAEGRLAEVVDHWALELSDEVVDLVQRLLRPDPADRLTVEGVRQHIWMRQ
jgi:serine/threonine protein kinase